MDKRDYTTIKTIIMADSFWQKLDKKLTNPHISFVCGRVPWLYQYWPGGFMVLWFYVQELPKAQLAVVLVLKRLRRRGNSL